MQKKNWMGMAFAALFVFTTACSDEQVGPLAGSVDLTDQESADVGELVVDQVDLILDDETAANPSVVSASNGSELISFSSVPVTTTFSITRERECRNGGNVTATGSGTHVADRAIPEVTLDFEGTKQMTDCAHARGDLVVTINGSGTFMGHRHRLNGAFEGLQTNDAAGTFTWSTNDERSGSCSYSIHAEWDPSTGIKTITGTVCDREINRTVTRDGNAGNDGR